MKAAPRTTPHPDLPVTRRTGNRRRPHGCKAGLLLVAVLGLFVIEGRRVQAHSELVSSDPAPGAVLASPPAEVSLVFSEPLDEGTTVDVIDSSFQSKRSGAPLRDFHDPLRVSVAVAGILTGTYTVEWTAIAVDSDVTRGSFAFEVQGDSASAPSEAAGRIGLPGSSLWLAVALVVVVIGLSLLLGRQDRGSARKG